MLRNKQKSLKLLKTKCCDGKTELQRSCSRDNSKGCGVQRNTNDFLEESCLIKAPK